MKTTAKAFIITLLSVAFAGIIGFTAYSAVRMYGHTHSFSDEWQTSEAYHWHSATCRHTTERADYGEHEWEDISSLSGDCEQRTQARRCIVCGYTETENPYKHQLTYTDNGADHTASCTADGCTYSYTEDHTYVEKDGQSVCSLCGHNSLIRLTVTVDDKSSIYGNAAEVLTYTVTKGTLLEGQDLVIELTKEEGDDVGTYDIIGTWTPDNVYDVTIVDGTYTIEPLTAVLAWSDLAFTYDGSAHQPTATVTNLVGEDTCSVTVSGAQTNVGNYTATASALGNSNYALPSATTQDFSIAALTAALNWSKTSFTYNATAQAPTAAVSNLVGTDTCIVTVTGAQTNVGNYTATASALGNSNYALPSANTQSFEITPLTASLNWTNTSFTYDGSAHKPTATVSNLVGEDTCSVTIGGEQTNAGTHTATATALDNSNYALPSANTQSFEIAALTAALSWTNTSLEYNGAEQAPTATVSNLVGTDTCSVTVTGGQTNVGTGYTATASALGNSNYALPLATTQSFDITKRAITVTIADKSSEVGNALEELTYSVTSGSELSEQKAGITLTKAAGTDKGTYDITGSFTNANYNVTFVNGTYTITLKTYQCPVCEKTIDTYCRHDSAVYFGFYPQSQVAQVASATTYAALNNSVEWATKKPTSSDSNGWTSYKYYKSNSNTTDYMWYIDKEYNGSKYRGVYFTEYRPYNAYTSGAGYSQQDENGYNPYTVYWFKYVPIRWNVMTESDGLATVIADLVIDAQAYQTTYTNKSGVYYNNNTDAPSGTFANNYQYSTIRTWLNETFYQAAFSSAQRSIIQKVSVDNSARSTNPNNNATQWNGGVNTYACDDTRDRVWLLSSQEVTNADYGFLASYATGDAARKKIASDYAKCQGTQASQKTGICSFWLRSPSATKSEKARLCYMNGSISMETMISTANVGVVPAMTLKLHDPFTRIDATGNEDEDGDYILFGSYPQTKVADVEITAALNTAIDWENKKPENGNNNGWTSYGYYISSSNTTDFMWYIDTKYNGEKYRGVYFTSYRPNKINLAANVSYSHQDEYGYVISEIYWFKYEPIKWRVLYEADDVATVLAELVLDSQPFDDDGSNSNNYAESTIRQWLNDTFYNTAFSDVAKAVIETTSVDNSSRSTNPNNNATQLGTNSYACADTEDKVWFLSMQEGSNSDYGFSADVFTGDAARKKYSTDYAQSQGIGYSSGNVGYAGWWLRSPNHDSSTQAYRSDASGVLEGGYQVTGTNRGVVPALKIRLKPLSEFTRVNAEGTEDNEGSYLLFGSYPQTKVTDTSITDALNTAIDWTNKKPSDGNNNGWTSYGYYKGTDTLASANNDTDYMWYIDVEYNGNKYRGVYYAQYRPNATCFNTGSTTSESKSYQVVYKYYAGNIYWFKYEPIQWRILTESNGKATVLAELIIDSQAYQNTYTTSYPEYYNNGADVPSKTYASNYEYSSIRAWLNESFYNTAFSITQQDLIATVVVDNSPDSSCDTAKSFSANSQYACSDTRDKVWLLSEQEATDSEYGFGTYKAQDVARQKKVTDYAKSQGVKTETSGTYKDIASWWLRSPVLANSNEVRMVNYNGSTDNIQYVNYTYNGIVPVITVDLEG